MNEFKILATALMAAGCMDAAAQVNDNHCGLVGFANYADDGINGTTGGAQGEVVRVTTREQLAQYAKGSTPYVIIIENDITGNGNIGEGAAGVKDYVSLGSNKTIIGAGSGVTLNKLGFDANGQQNIILRNLKITNCNPDALAFRKTHHVWVDHCDLSSSADGLLDYTLGSSYLSVSWTKFSDHDKVSICNSGTQHFEDNGRERATYHHCWFDNTTQRNPRFGYGLGHVFNNYYTKNSSYCVGYHTQAKVVVENTWFSNTNNPLNQMYTGDSYTANYADVLARNNKFESVSGNKKDTGTGFDISRYYDYSDALDKLDNVKDLSAQMGLAADLEYDIIPFPGNDATGVTADMKLQCGALYGATAYAYYIADESNGTANYQAYDAETTTLKPGTKYSWYAVVTTADKTYTSSTFHFTTAAAQASTPTPLNGEQHANLREALTEKGALTTARLQWRPAQSAASYKVYLAKGETVDDSNLIGETTATKLNPGALEYGQTYAWRVDAVAADGTVTKGETWTFSSDKAEAKEGKNEMEKAVRNGYAYLELGSDYRTYSGSYAVVGEAGPGSMSFVWAGDEADYDITTTYFDWQSYKKYKGSYALYVNEQLQDSWFSQTDGSNMIDHKSASVSLHTGDELRIEFYTDDKMRLRTDYITVAKAAVNGIRDVEQAETQKTLRVYTIDGRFIGTSVNNLPSGIYIVNGKKVAF